MPCNAFSLPWLSISLVHIDIDDDVLAPSSPEPCRSIAAAHAPGNLRTAEDHEDQAIGYFEFLKDIV